MKSKANLMGGFKEEKTDSHQLEGQPRQKRGQRGSSYTCIYIYMYIFKCICTHLFVKKHTNFMM